MKINKFYKFKEVRSENIFESILNESRVYFSPRFREILMRVNGDIGLSLLGSERTDIKDDMTFIDLDDSKLGYITFTKMSKAKKNLEDDDYYSFISARLNDLPISFSDNIYNTDIGNLYSKDRDSIRLSRAINKISKQQFTPSEIDLFSRKVIAKLNKDANVFKLLTGEDIGIWYDSSLYAQNKGSLGGSCMKNKSASFFSLYNKNIDVCSMLILLDDEEKLIGRALVWKLKTHNHSQAPKELYFMDRQYVNDETDVQRFINYANEKGWAYKTSNSYSGLKGVTYKESNEMTNMEVEIIAGYYDKYPYMDTFRTYDPSQGILFNSDGEGVGDGYYILDSTSGGYTGASLGIYCEYDDEYVDDDYAIWSEAVNSFIHVDRAVEVTHGSNSGWYPETHDDLVMDEWMDELIHRDDAIYSDYYDYYILDDNSVEAIIKIDSNGMPTQTSYIVKSDTEFYKKSRYFNTIWYKVLSEKYDEWKLIDYLDNDLTFRDNIDDICLNEFKVKVYKLENISNEAKEIGIDKHTGLNKNDALILNCKISTKPYYQDIFTYYHTKEEILKEYYNFLIKKKEEIEFSLSDKKLLDLDNKEDYITNLKNMLYNINSKIREIDSEDYIKMEKD